MVGYKGTAAISERNEIDMDQHLLVIQLKKNGRIDKRLTKFYTRHRKNYLFCDLTARLVTTCSQGPNNGRISTAA